MTALITPAELPKWVPGKILVASDDLGWNGVGLRSYRYLGQDVDVPALRDFTIVSYRVGATPMERRFDGAWTRTKCVPGDVSLLTRSQRSHWHWTDEIDVCHLYLSEGLVSGIANEIMDRSVAEVRLRDVLKAEDPIVTAGVDTIASEATTPSLGGALYVEAVATQLTVHLLRNYASVRFREAGDKGRLSPGQARRVAEYIDSRLHEPLSLETLAGVAGLGVWSFTRRFRQSFGRAPHAYVIERRVERRVERARGLLAQGLRPVKEIASACGFADQAHMTRVFQARLHTTPAALRSRAAAGRGSATVPGRRRDGAWRPLALAFTGSMPLRPASGRLPRWPTRRPPK
jgi:AraC family transcriptional regulator